MIDFIALLKGLGFTEYESRTYFALAKLGPSTAREVAIESKLPRNKTYEMLNHLVQKGHVSLLPITPRKYKLINIRKLADEIDKKKKEVDDLESKFSEFEKFIESPDRSGFNEIFWVIKGQRAIAAKIAEETSALEKEAISVVRRSLDYLPGLKNVEQATKRGVKTRIMGVIDKDNYKTVQKWMEAGVEFRAYDEEKFGPTGTRFSVFDKKKVRITIGKPEVTKPEDYTTLWAESPSLAAMMRNHFYNMWEKAKPAERVIKQIEAKEKRSSKL
jgi:sugar-specific transcriptional regulator TrmB